MFFGGVRRRGEGWEEVVRGMLEGDHFQERKAGLGGRGGEGDGGWMGVLGIVQVSLY